MAKKWSKCNIHAWSLKSFTSGSCEKKNTGRNAQMKQNQISFEFKIENAYNRTTLLCEYSVMTELHLLKDITRLMSFTWVVTQFHAHMMMMMSKSQGYLGCNSIISWPNIATKTTNYFSSRLLKWMLLYERFMQWYREFCGFKLIFLFLFLAISDYFIDIS